MKALLVYSLLSSVEIPVVNSQGKKKKTHTILGQGFLQVCFASVFTQNLLQRIIRVLKNQCSAEEVVCYGHFQTKY